MPIRHWKAVTANEEFLECRALDLSADAVVSLELNGIASTGVTLTKGVNPVQATKVTDLGGATIKAGY